MIIFGTVDRIGMGSLHIIEEYDGLIGCYAYNGCVKISNLLNMNALPLSHVSTELATPSLSASSGGENSCVMCLVDTIITGLEPFPPQPLRSYDEKGFPITIDSSSESLDYERRLVAGMFPADINKDKFIPLTRAESESYRRLVTGMF